MAANTFNAITELLNTGLTAEALAGASGLSATSMLTYPPGLAIHTSDEYGYDDKPQNEIPYVLFMPYVTPPGPDLTRLNSLHASTVLDNLPNPKFAIALPLPPSALKTTYGVHYDTVDLGQGVGYLAGAASSTGSALSGGLKQIFDMATTGKGPSTVEAVKGLADTFIGAATVMASGVGTGIYQIVRGAAEGAGAGTVLDKGLGFVENPFTEHVYNKVADRKHEFVYTFMPKNEAESKTIDRIIQLFKFYMLPANFGNDLYFSFPYEFQIFYSVAGTTFTLLPSVLESLSVDYSDSVGSPKFFAAAPGQLQYPAKIDLTLSFQEVMLMTRDKIAITPADVVREEAPGVTRYRF